MHKKGWYILVLFVIFGPVYLLRLQSKLRFDFKDNQRIKVVSVLSQEPKLQANAQIFRIEGVWVKASRFPEFHYSDHLTITGNIQKQVINPLQKQFWLIDPTIIQITSDSKKLLLKNLFMNHLFNFRKRLENVFGQLLPEPQASLIIGIVLGIPRSLSNDFYEALKITGTLHIIVASGMNISLTAGILGEFLSRFLKRKLALIVSLVCIAVYCLIAGLTPPIVRAGLMASIIYLSQFLGKEALGFWILLLTALIMLVISPLLLFDIGFQLSFMATAGLICLGPRLQKWLYKIKFTRAINEEIAETLAAQIFTLPILAITFGRFSPISLIPNIFIIPLVPYIMFMGMIIGFFGLFWFGLAQIISWFAWLPLTYMIKVIGFFGQFKIFYLSLNNLSWIFGLGYYLLLFNFVIKTNEQNH